MNWSVDRDFAAVRDGLPEETKLTTVRKALEKLVRDGELARDPASKAYRRASSRA